MSKQCKACADFRLQRDQLIQDVAVALGEVTKLRRLNDFYKEKLEQHENGRPTTASSFLRRRFPNGGSADEGNSLGETDLALQVSHSQQAESALMALQCTIRTLRGENQMLKQQRDDFASQVKELTLKLDGEIEVTADRAEERLAAMRPGTAKTDFEEEFKELKRLRILMRFSELKKDSDKLQETFQYVSKLETENTGLRAQLERMYQQRERGGVVSSDTNTHRCVLNGKRENPPPQGQPSRPSTGLSNIIPSRSASTPSPRKTVELQRGFTVEPGERQRNYRIRQKMEESVPAADVDVGYSDEDIRVDDGYSSSSDSRQSEEIVQPREIRLTSSHSGPVANVHQNFHSWDQFTPQGNSARGAPFENTWTFQSSQKTYNQQRAGVSSSRPQGSAKQMRFAPASSSSSRSQPVGLQTNHSLKQELTTAQALLELLNSRPRAGTLGVSRPQTAAGTGKKMSYH